MKNENLKDAPAWYVQFVEDHPNIAEKYQALGEAVHQGGPLDDKTRALIKMAISGTGKVRQAFRTHVRKARAVGVNRKEMDHVALLMLPTIGFPSTMAALKMINEEFTTS